MKTLPNNKLFNTSQSVILGNSYTNSWLVEQPWSSKITGEVFDGIKNNVRPVMEILFLLRREASWKYND